MNYDIDVNPNSSSDKSSNGLSGLDCFKPHIVLKNGAAKQNQDSQSNGAKKKRKKNNKKDKLEELEPLK